MVKKDEDARTRLQKAALRLFVEHGYDGTTAAEIAAAAGVTERTFFRYFADKREVLFDGEAFVQRTLTDAVAAAPEKLGALDTLLWAFRAFEPMMVEKRSYLKPRHAIIRGTPALHERELAKLDALGAALTLALQARGVSQLRADLAVRTGLVAFVHATLEWLQSSKGGFGSRLDLAIRELRTLLVPSGADREPAVSAPKLL